MWFPVTILSMVKENKIKRLATEGGEKSLSSVNTNKEFFKGYKIVFARLVMYDLLLISLFIKLVRRSIFEETSWLWTVLVAMGGKLCVLLYSREWKIEFLSMTALTISRFMYFSRIILTFWSILLITMGQL